MDTIKKGRYENMNKMFRKHKNYDLRFKKKISSNLAKEKRNIEKKFLMKEKNKNNLYSRTKFTK